MTEKVAPLSNYHTVPCWLLESLNDILPLLHLYEGVITRPNPAFNLNNVHYYDDSKCPANDDNRRNDQGQLVLLLLLQWNEENEENEENE